MDAAAASRVGTAASERRCLAAATRVGIANYLARLIGFWNGCSGVSWRRALVRGG